MIDRPNILLALLIPGFRLGRTGFVVGLTLATLLVLTSLIGEEFYWDVDWLFAVALLGVWVTFMSLVNRFIDLGAPWLWLLLAPIPVINLLLIGRFLFGPGAIAEDNAAERRSPWEDTAAAANTPANNDNDAEVSQQVAENAWRLPLIENAEARSSSQAVERTRPLDDEDAVQRL